MTALFLRSIQLKVAHKFWKNRCSESKYTNRFIIFLFKRYFRWFIYIYIYRHRKVDHSSLMLVHSELPLTVILVIYIYVTISVSSWRDFYAESCQKELSEIILIKTVDIELNYYIREKKKYKRIGFQVVASSFTCLGGSPKCHPMKITCWIDWHLSEGKRNL